MLQPFFSQAQSSIHCYFPVVLPSRKVYILAAHLKKLTMYDTIIIGAGAAGLSAAVYSTRFKLKTLVISKDIGGTGLIAHKVENWLGEQSISGTNLMEKFERHAHHLGVEIERAMVSEIKKCQGHFKVNNKETKSIIFATGMARRELNIEGAEKFRGKGISYCASCDAPFYKNKTVCVVGGGDAATTAAALLSSYANKVYLLARGKQMRAEPVNQEKIIANKKIEVLFNAEIAKISGKKTVEAITLKDGGELPLNGIFVEIGAVPSTELGRKINIAFNEHSEIIVDRMQRTNIGQAYAAGDCTDFPFKQFITAASQGAVAALSCFQDLKSYKD